MARTGRERLKGLVEIDETHIAITDRQNTIPPLHRKSRTDKIMIAIAVEILQPKGFGRIRLRRLSSDSKESVRQFVRNSIDPNSTVRTDGSGSYAKLHELGYNHERTVMLGSQIPAHVSMVGVHRVAALLKRWILGTHHGSIQPEHLDAYLEEFVFRFNRRSSAYRGMLFYRLLQQAVVTDPVTYRDIICPDIERGKAA
jgi:transposase-like protein